MEDSLESYPLAKCRQGALFQRNPVCALCFRVCKELCNTYGGIRFDLLRSMQAADALCAYFVEHAWEPPDVEQCRQWLEEHLNNESEVMVACAILSLSTSAMVDAPEPLRSRGQDIRCLIYGEADYLYTLFHDAVWHEHLSFSAGNYGPCPPLPAELRNKKAIIRIPPKQLKRMQATQNNQYNGPVFNGPVFNGPVYNGPVYQAPVTQNYAQAPAAPKPECSEDSSTIPPDFFCISARFSEENIRERLAAELSLSTTKVEYCRALYRLQHIGCINLNQYASDAQRAIVFNRFQSKFNLSPDDFCRARMNK